MNIALLPLYIIRPLAIIALMGAGQVVALPADAKSAMIASVIATWATALLQFVLLNRSLSAITPVGVVGMSGNAGWPLRYRSL
jgi:hypothetical protein